MVGLQITSSTPVRRRPGTIWRHKSAIFGLILFGSMLIGALLAGWVSPYDPGAQDLSASLQPPAFAGGSTEHLLGTDRLGRDILSRVLHGGRISLLVAVAAFAIQSTVGTLLGLLSGYLGGRVDQVIMRIADIQLALPGLVALLAAVAIFGPSLFNLILFLGIAGWPGYARIVRSEVLSLRERDFVEAARVLGATRGRILRAHILPNVLTSLIVIATIATPGVILAEASLSFLGLGAPPDVPTWGTMVNDGRPFIATAWWVSMFPGLAIVVTVLGINLLGDTIRDVMDPRSRRLR
ncbi:MAG: ABC transporter permease [Actinobacteria bacterium]|nr:ABC transporter permease [Actinomycetota bacterium]